MAIEGQAGAQLVQDPDYRAYSRRLERWKHMAFKLRSVGPDHPMVSEVVQASGLADCMRSESPMKRKAAALAYIREQREDARAALKACKADLVGDAQLFDFSLCAGQKKDLSRKMIAFKSTRLVRVGKRKHLVSREELSHRIAYKLLGCSTLLVRQENTKDSTSRLVFRNGCHHSACPVCQPIRSRSYAAHIAKEIDRQVENMREDASCGSLVHITLTAENRPDIEGSLLVMDAWRRVLKDRDTDYSRKINYHAVWKHVPWGWSKFEDHQSAVNRYWHGHMHVLAWLDGFAGVGLPDRYLSVMERLHPYEREEARDLVVSGRRGRTRKVRAVRLWAGPGARIIVRPRGFARKRLKPTYWEAMRWSWYVACKREGLRVNVKQSQSLRIVASCAELRRSSPSGQLHAAAAEIAKYTSKPIDLEKVDGIDGLIELSAALFHRRVINGFGGVSVKPMEADLLPPTEPGEHIREVSYRYQVDRYVPTLDVPWSDEAWAEMLAELTNRQLREVAILNYEITREKMGVQGAQPPAALETFRNNCPEIVVSESNPTSNLSFLPVQDVPFDREKWLTESPFNPVSVV